MFNSCKEKGGRGEIFRIIQRMKKFSLSDLTLRPTTPPAGIATARSHVEKERNVGRDCEQVESEEEGRKRENVGANSSSPTYK